MRIARSSAAGLVLLGASLACTSCEFLAMRGETRKIHRVAAALEGRVAQAASPGTPLVAVLYHVTEKGSHPIDLFPLRRSGAYFFLVLPGRYAIAAFEDPDDDLQLHGSEPGGVAAGGDPIEVKGGDDLTGLDIVIGTGVGPELRTPIDARTLWRASGPRRPGPIFPIEG